MSVDPPTGEYASYCQLIGRIRLVSSEPGANTEFMDMAAEMQTLVSFGPVSVGGQYELQVAWSGLGDETVWSAVIPYTVASP